jgi:hypothetical protein
MDGTAVRTVTIKNLSKTRVSVKVRAYTGTHYTDGNIRNYEGIYGDFSKAKTVKVIAQKKGYKTSYNFSKVKKGDTIEFGTYEQDYPVDGKDPIEWIVLDKTKNGIFVMSKLALECLSYNIEYMDVTWETCTLRKWLDEKFYYAAFNKTEKGMIKKTTVQNYDNPLYETEGGNGTKNKVFLLAIDDASEWSYGFDTKRSVEDIHRKCAPSKYAVAQGAGSIQSTDKDDIAAENKGTCNWWLRSPGILSSYAANVGFCGSVICAGMNVDNCYGYAVRPAMWIKLKSE